MTLSLLKNWQDITLGDISSLITKGSSPRWQGFDYQTEGMFFVTSENVRNGYLDTKSEKFLPLEFHQKLKKSQLKNNDLLINIVGASIGRSCMYQMEYEEANINQAVCLVRLNNDVSHYFVLQYLQNPKTVERLLDSRAGSGRPNLSLYDIRTFTIFLPPLLEQHRIVQVLETWDKAIKKLERKIELKKNAKKGLMQQLLTGKKRLPGFSGEWEMNALGSFIEFQSGYGFPLSVQGKENEKYPFLKVSDMNLAGNGIYIRSWNNTVSDEDLAALKAKSFPVNSIIFPKIGAAIATNKKRILSVPSLVDNNVMVAIAKENLDYQFFFQWLLTFDLSEWANSGGVPSMRKSTIENYIVNFPKLEEQIAIAKILTSSEQEIERQQSKLQKLKAQKTYLLNHLITGRIRTPESMSLSS